MSPVHRPTITGYPSNPITTNAHPHATTSAPDSQPAARHPHPDSQPAATLRPSDSHPIATLPPPDSQPAATLLLADSHPIATLTRKNPIPRSKTHNLHPDAPNSTKHPEKPLRSSFIVLRSTFIVLRPPHACPHAMRSCETGQGSAICLPASFRRARSVWTWARPAPASSVKRALTSGSVA